MRDDLSPPVRTVKQIVDKAGTPFEATATQNVWVGLDKVFSLNQEGNSVKPFVTGEEYFKDLAEAILGATSEICIAGWQVNWDALLTPKLRLYDVLLAAAKKNVKIRVMPWDDTKPMLTYDAQTKSVLESINDHDDVKSNPVQVILSKALATTNAQYYSHHQKLVVIDRKIAYIGGIDISYGRFDDATYDLTANACGREVLNRYNPCIPWNLSLDAEKLVDPDYLTGMYDSLFKARGEREKISNGGWQVPYHEPGMLDMAKNTVSSSPRIEKAKASPFTLDPHAQPRMPWQDAHCRIEGPSVSDVLRNFVLRWHASGGARMELPKPPSAYEKVGNTHVQVLRSAPANMRAKEAAATRSPNGKAPAGTEDHIHQAMVQLINNSSKFIYIENQFFVSDFGKESESESQDLSPAASFINSAKGSDQNSTARAAAAMSKEGRIHPTSASIDLTAALAPPTNGICQALIKRIERAILDIKGPHFHVYITIPVHPEGCYLNTASIAVQVYWTMQTISFGSNSLLNGIRRALKAKALRKAGDEDYRRVIDDLTNTEYKDIPVEECFEYVTLLNLRNWALLGEGKNSRYVTEQVYVHTKLLIVDDLYVLHGSANINDRSLLGERDSEIAVLVVDGDASRADTCGTGSQRPIRTYAHELRKKIWSKLFGITGGIRAATHLANAIEQPGIPDSWRSIRKQADANAQLYEDAFPYIPRNWSPLEVTKGDKRQPASIIPNWDPEARHPGNPARRGYPASPLPFQDSFWETPQHVPEAATKLVQVKGYITSLPIQWTRGEMNRFSYPTAMVAMQEQSLDSAAPQNSMALAETGTNANAAYKEQNEPVVTVSQA
jgi:phospholipase D1/2